VEYPVPALTVTDPHPVVCCALCALTCAHCWAAM
jgi:hypothetical protein